MHVDRSGRAGTGPRGGEKPPGQPGAALHRHTLDRVNAINDSLKKNKNRKEGLVLTRLGLFRDCSLPLVVTRLASCARSRYSSLILAFAAISTAP